MADNINNAKNLIPFGKYKGQPVEILANDPQYCEWLTSQDWFRERYQPIYTIIINHFGEPAETPEHNQLQALFLDQHFRRRFVCHLLGGQQRVYESICKARDKRIPVVQNTIKLIQKGCEDARRWNSQFDPQKSENEIFIRGMGLIRAPGKAITEFEDEIRRLENHPLQMSSDAEFETGGVDVVIRYSSGILDHDMWGEIHAECKPSVGDDYPAILRRIGSQDPSFRTALVLFIGDGGYRGTGATLDQVRAIFASRKIQVILKSEIP